MTNVDEGSPSNRLTGWRWWLACGLVLAAALAATVPTAGDLGLTWDEPAYRFSQLRSAQWWGRLVRARSASELSALVESNALLFYWTYARHGINFHPPLAGQLSLLTYEVFGGWMKDIPARRMASVLEYSLAITIGFGFLARRYGICAGIVMAGSLLTMPRVYGDCHIAATDAPGLLLWPATAIAFWKGLYEPEARRWRVLVGILMGLAFIEKMAAVFVVVPLAIWILVTRLPKSFSRARWASDWTDGLLTTGAMLLPLGIAFAEILRLRRYLPKPKFTNLFVEHPASYLPGVILAVPLAIWIVRRVLARVFGRSPIWGTERPGLETCTAILAFAPIVGWLGNPAWWLETLPRLAHYYMINTDRRNSLPDIQIIYLGQIYEYSLPWHNGWVLIAITVPASVLAASIIGLAYMARVARWDPLPVFFVLNLLALPVARMLPTPAHDGVRLMLPTFFFVAAFAGWGASWVADGLARLARGARVVWVYQTVIALLVLVPSAWQLAKVHPFELSYYNELIGGPRGAWNAGFELSYWYDAFNPSTLAENNERLPDGCSVDIVNEKTASSVVVFLELQSLGELRGDVVLGSPNADEFPYVWLLTQDSKASAFTRLLFALKPWYRLEPRQLDGARVVTIADPVAVSRAYALWLMLDAADDQPPQSSSAPSWVRKFAPFLGRLWGEGVTKIHRLTVNEALLDWAKAEPDPFLAGARFIADRHNAGDDAAANRLLRVLERYGKRARGDYAAELIRNRPEAIVEAAKIIATHPDAVRTVLTRSNYTDPSLIGGALDRDLP